MNDAPLPLNVLYRDHTRHWQENLYVYAVLSRRSGGISVGINLNPDRACNFDCIYCQVDRTTPPQVRQVELTRLDAELRHTLADFLSGELFRRPPFDALPPDLRIVRDIAFSGDGEPTTCKEFPEAVGIAARARQEFKLEQSKLVLITDACYLKRDSVRAALKEFDAANGEIWAKLDAGTEAYYEQVNRPNHPLKHVIDNIVDAARVRPVVIQSLFMRIHGTPPPITEIDAYCDRLHDIVTLGGQIRLVQIYTIARRTTESYATPLSNEELDALAQRIAGQVSLPIARFYGAG